MDKAHAALGLLAGIGGGALVYFLTRKPAAALEGNFTTYNEKWNIPMASVTHQDMAVSGRNVFFDDISGGFNSVVDVETGAPIVASQPPYAWIIGGQHFNHQSILGRYVVRIAASDTVEIWKDGALILTLTPFTNAQSVSISPDGRYVMISDYGAGVLYFLEGA